LKGIIDDIFTEVVRLLITEGYIKFEDYFLDGTKIEANANKHSCVWKKNTDRYMEDLREKVVAHLKAIDIIESVEEAEYGSEDLPETGNGREINSESIKEFAQKINERLTENPDNKDLKDAKKAIEKDYLPRMEKYEEQHEILGDRNSYSKTDTDATFMRMKEDDQVRPAYNVQIGTENQFITGYSIHQKPGDTTTLKAHFEKIKDKMDGQLPKNATTDAAYGSEENYEYLKGEGITAYVKYNTFHTETSKKWKEDLTKVHNYTYDENTDTYHCFGGQTLVFMEEKEKKSENGYISTVRIYESVDCSGCVHRQNCVKSEKESPNRRIQVNRRLNELKAEARELLNSKTGIAMRSKRSVEVESVFGDIKGNYGVRRFLLRGLEKVGIEWGLYSIGHNMRKILSAIMG
jgi:DNA-binding IscR family transcriptional regulator